MQEKTDFSNKKRLKSTGISITEKLRAERMVMLKEAREKHHFTNAWGPDTKSLYKDMSDKKIRFYYV